MLLRKHIQGGRLSSVAQKGSERIIEFGIDAVNELGFAQGKRLIVEIMGKHSNIILMDSASGKIIDSIKRLSPDMNRYRQTLPGSPYIEPPSHGKLSWYDATAEDIAALTASCGGDDNGDGGNCHASGDNGDGGNCHASGDGRDSGDALNYKADAADSIESYDPAAQIALSECVSRSLLGGIQGISPRAADELAASIAARVFGSEMSGGVSWANCHADAAGADKSGDDADRSGVGTGGSAVREESSDGVDGGRAGIGRVGVDGGRAGIGRVGMAAWGAISGMVSAIQTGRFAPCVYIDENGAPADFHAFPLAAFEGAYKAERFGDISSAIEFYYSNKDSSNRMRQKTSDLIKAVNAGINKLQLKKQRLLEDLVKAENSDHDRLLGELLTANLHNIKPGQKTAEITNYYDGSTVAIDLDPRLSPSQNAQRFYKRYAKAKTAIIEKNNQLAETDRELIYLESVLAFLENASAYEDAEAIRQELIDEGYLRRRKAPASKKPPKPTFLSYQTSGGLQALAGRNNRENDILTF
jgi:hypothetical protein